MSSNYNLEQLARHALSCWDALDADAVMDCFADDAVLHVMMIDPIVGKDAIRKEVEREFKSATFCHCNIKHIAVSGDSTVLVERVDEFINKGKKGAVPVVGSLDFRDGKIVMWREYMDFKQFGQQMGWPSMQD